MEPNHNTIPGHNEVLPSVPGGESLPEPEHTAAAPETSPASQAQPTTIAQANPVPDPAAIAQSTAVPMPPATQVTQAMIADDADLIEKEWVERAKAIVAQTKDDPHLQNREINKVKAVYLKKRYNKDLKVSEE